MFGRSRGSGGLAWIVCLVAAQGLPTSCGPGGKVVEVGGESVVGVVVACV